jgi:hypothetical protein
MQTRERTKLRLNTLVNNLLSWAGICYSVTIVKKTEGFKGYDKLISEKSVSLELKLIFLINMMRVM